MKNQEFTPTKNQKVFYKSGGEAGVFRKFYNNNDTAYAEIYIGDSRSGICFGVLKARIELRGDKLYINDREE